MKITVNKARCAAMGNCEAIAPELFEITDDGGMELRSDEVTPELEDRVRQAIEACPTMSLTLSD